MSAPRLLGETILEYVNRLLGQAQAGAARLETVRAQLGCGWCHAMSAAGTGPVPCTCPARCPRPGCLGPEAAQASRAAGGGDAR